MAKDLVGQNLNIQTLQKAVLNLWAADKLNAVELGKALITLRDAMKDVHGDFKKWYQKDAKLETNRVYYCIRLAEGKIAKPEAKPKEDGKPKEQPAVEHLLTPEVWQDLSRHAAKRGIAPLALVQQICFPAISAWLAAQEPFADLTVAERAA